MGAGDAMVLRQRGVAIQEDEHDVVVAHHSDIHLKSPTLSAVCDLPMHVKAPFGAVGITTSLQIIAILYLFRFMLHAKSMLLVCTRLNACFQR